MDINTASSGAWLDLINNHKFIIFIVVPSLAIAVISTTISYIIESFIHKKTKEHLQKDSIIVLENSMATILSVMIALFYLYGLDIDGKYVFYDMMFMITLTALLIRIEFYRTITSAIKWKIIKLISYSDKEKEDIIKGINKEVIKDNDIIK